MAEATVGLVHVEQAAEAVESWMRLERILDFNGGDYSPKRSPYNRYNAFVSLLLPRAWDYVQDSAESEVSGRGSIPEFKFHTNQRLLKACSAASSARLWELVLEGAEPWDASKQSMAEVGEYLGDTEALLANLADPTAVRGEYEDVIVAQALLTDPLASRAERFTQLTTSLAVARLATEAATDLRMNLPIPGLSVNTVM